MKNQLAIVFTTVIFIVNVVSCVLGKSNEASEQPYIFRSPSIILNESFAKPDAPKIVGGLSATDGQFPYQVAIKTYESTYTYYFCGGSILNSTFILTAGHCVTNDQTGKNTYVYVGGIKYNDWTVQKSVKKVYLHEDYYLLAGKIPVNDVALLELESELPLSDKISNISLQKTDVKIDTKCTVSGWGTLNEGDSAPMAKTLQYVDIYMSECTNYGQYAMPGMICVGTSGGGKDACQGDSGGPLVCDGKQTGIVSWGSGCARVGYPGVYTNIKYYYSWITGLPLDDSESDDGNEEGSGDNGGGDDGSGGGSGESGSGDGQGSTLSISKLLIVLGILVSCIKKLSSG